MNLVEVKNLTKKYDDTYALQNVSLKIKPKEFVMIVGKSGSGKSTLLHILAGIDEPTEGKVIINGSNIFDFSNKDLTFFRRDNIGMVYQAYNLLPSLNVKENILLPTYITKREKNKFSEIIETLDLKDKLDSMPSELSGGGKQRVAIARALINNPKIILADEPTGNLDQKSREEIMKLLKKYNQKGQTIIMVTHDTELLKYATRVIKLSDGKIIKDNYAKKNNMVKHQGK